MTDNTKLKFEIKSFDSIHPDIGYSNQAEYICDYLKNFEVKSCVLEYEYIDKDFLIDFANFYSRSFDINTKYTTRIHFFEKDITIDYLNDLIENYTENECKKLNDTYLGFVIVKPIQDIKGNKFLGRTLLKTYQKKDGSDCRSYLTQNYNISLFGLPLSVKTLPFIPQDSVVGGCATSACWVALHPLHSLFGIQEYSPYEITKLATVFPYEDRNFPSEGLTVQQMKTQFNSLGLDTEFISIAKIKSKCRLYKNKIDDVIADSVKAYNRLGLPIIATLYLKKGRGKTSYHAVTISGCRCDHDGKVMRIYVHDDQIGPFHRVEPDGNFSKWKNKWREHEVLSVEVDELIIPVYQKIRLNFGLIYSTFIQNKRATEEISKELNINGVVDLFLIDLHNYKKHLLKYKFPNKVETLQQPMPRFLWIIRQLINNELSCDMVYDATAVYPKEITTINYDINQKEVEC
jgi:hypothetical protein